MDHVFTLFGFILLHLSFNVLVSAIDRTDLSMRVQGRVISLVKYYPFKDFSRVCCFIAASISYLKTCY